MLVYAVALVAIVTLAMLHRRDRNGLIAQRAQFFDHCLDLFQSYRITQKGTLYPLLSGRYRDHDIRLEPVIDDMAWRKVPVLWLRTTILKPNSYSGVLDLLIRPGGVEVYSPSNDLHCHLPLPRGWPEEALLCTDDPQAIPPLDHLTPHLTVFNDPKMKELVTTSRGVRLVRMIWQASRRHYGVLREVRFTETHLDPEVVRIMLDAVVAIAETISGSTSVERAA